MPLPTPQDEESLEAFTSRCMADETMNEEYADKKQRYAVCVNQYIADDE